MPPSLPVAQRHVVCGIIAMQQTLDLADHVSLQACLPCLQLNADIPGPLPRRLLCRPSRQRRQRLLRAGRPWRSRHVA